MQHPPKKGRRGGKRPGAGRPIANPDEGPTQTLTCTVPRSLLERFDAIIKGKRIGRSAGLTVALRRYVVAEEQREARKAERQQKQHAKKS